MSSNAQSKLPTIKLTKANLIPGTNGWVSTADSIRGALESYGCFIAVYEEINLKLHDEMFELAKELFDLPMETKMKNKSDIPGFGYGGNFRALPLFEYAGIENGANLEDIKNFTSIMWPRGNDNFCRTAQLYCKMLLDMDHMILQMVVQSYNVERCYKDLTQSAFYLTRFIKYQLPKENENNIGLVPHTDNGFVSILDTNYVKGLEIETRDGKWIEFEPSPLTYLVMAGDALMAWSNGRIHAPVHRVIIRGKEEKYSIVNFSFSSSGMLQVPEELVDAENPLKFKPFSNREYLEYLKKKGSNIKNFCGV